MGKNFEITVSESNGQWWVPISSSTKRRFEWLRPAAESALAKGLDSGADVITITIERP